MTITCNVHSHTCTLKLSYVGCRHLQTNCSCFVSVLQSFFKIRMWKTHIFLTIKAWWLSAIIYQCGKFLAQNRRHSIIDIMQSFVSRTNLGIVTKKWLNAICLKIKSIKYTYIFHSSIPLPFIVFGVHVFYRCLGDVVGPENNDKFQQNLNICKPTKHLNIIGTQSNEF